MAEQKQSNIEELVKLLEMRKDTDHPTVLLLGSRVGGLFRGKHPYENLQRFSHRTFSQLSRTDRFSECYAILTKNRFVERKAHYIRASYDSFMRELYNCLYGVFSLPVNYQLAVSHADSASHAHSIG